MARIGLDSLYVAKILTDDYDTQTTYDAPVRIAGAINLGLTKTVAEGTLYADDQLDTYIATQTGQEISINVKDLSIANEALLLGKKVATNGGIATSGEDNAPEFAVMFRSKTSEGIYKYVVLYKVKFRPYDETYDTQSDNVAFQTPTITGRSFARYFDGYTDFKLDGTPANKTIVDKWFTAPTEHTATLLP